MTSNRSARGFSMIELVVASMLLVTVLAGMSLVVANSERALLETRLQDNASTLGLSVAERSLAFNCGTAVDPMSASTTQTANRCADVYAGVLAAGDVTFDTSDTNGQNFSVAVATRWRQTGAGTACFTTTGVDAAQQMRPALLERVVSLTYSLLGSERTKTIVSVQATPDSSAYLGQGSGGILVSAPTGTLVTINRVGGTPISRFTSDCTPTPAAYFPFLPPGEYLVGRDGSANQPVSVSAGTVQEVTVS